MVEMIIVPIVCFVLLFAFLGIGLRKVPETAQPQRAAVLAAFICTLPTVFVVADLLDAVSRQRVVACTVGHSHGAYAAIELENGGKRALHQEKCVPIGAWLEKRRWELGYRIADSLPYYDNGHFLRSWIAVTCGGLCGVASFFFRRRKRAE